MSPTWTSSINCMEVVRQYGRKLDVIFANAGIALQAPLGTVDEKFFDLHFNANVKGLFFTTRRGAANRRAHP
jgi:NAD(P)-dependent dehydrogenase (short-subunit alcohol dehydrogenase family)